MKKAISFLLAFGLLIMPMTAFAVSFKPSIPENELQEVTNADGTVTKTYNVYVDIEKEAGEGDTEKNSFDFSFEYGSAIKTFTCADAGDFIATESTSGTGNTKNCSFALPEGKKLTGNKVKVGAVTITVDKNAKNEDCFVNYMLEGASGKINPETGANIPYAFIAGGLFVAAVVYFTTKKRTKLYKI